METFKLNLPPESIANLLNRYKLTAKETKTKPWQEKALESCKFLIDSDKFKGSIFKCYKVDDHLADIALLDCRELNKPYSRYFLKVFSALKIK